MSITIDSKEVERAFKLLPSVIKKEARITIKEELTKVQRRSSIVHRYTAHSNFLDKAYRLEMDSDFEGTLYLDKTISNAPYAWAIHSGRSDWPNYKADLFLDNAGKYQEPSIIKALKKVSDTAIKKVGLS